MPSIEDRIVAMAFENAKFEANLAQTMASLAKLDASLKKIGQTNSLGDIEKSANKVTLEQPMSALDKLKTRFSRSGADAAQGLSEIEKAGDKVSLSQPIKALDAVQSKTAEVGAGASKGFSEIEGAASRVNLGGITSALENVTSKFSIIQGAAAVAFGNIASKAAMVGGQVVKSLTISPVMAGFQNYETQINAVQTIMANTGLEGKKGLGTVQKSLDELNTYANQTVYNFSEMAKNIGTFTAAGVDLKTATASIKGIANLAALSGSNSQQASTAMYQLSQAIAAGKVGLQDWNSVVNAGMGGAVFQKALMQTGVAMGTVKKGAVEIDKATGKATINGESFRNSIMAKPGTQSWLTSKVLTTTLKNFTGDMSKAQLQQEGFTEDQIKNIQKQAKAAVGAATNIKTVTQLMDALKEEVATAWGAIFKTIFGNIFDATKVFSSLHVAAENALTGPIYALNKTLQGWSKLGGRTTLIRGLKQMVTDLKLLIKPIQGAFRDIFPPATAKSLLTMTQHFATLMKRLQPTVQTATNLHKTFRGLFALLHIGVTIVKDLIGVITHLLGSVGSHAGGFLQLTGGLGTFLFVADKTLTKGGALKKFFDGLYNVLRKPMELIGKLTSGLSHLFGGAAGGKVAGNMGAIKDAADPLTGALHRLKGAWDGLVKLFEQAKNLVSPWLDKIGHELSRIGDVIKNAFSGENLGRTTSLIQTAFLGGIFLAIRKAIFGGVTELGGAVKGLTGVLKGVQGVLGGMTKQLEVMQQKVKAQILVEIATAVGILAAAAFVLSTIQPAKLAKAMTAIAVGLGELMGSMKIMTGGLGKTGIAKLPVIAGSLIAMSTAVLILSGAMKVMATMSWDQLARGMAGIGGGLGIIARTMALMPKGRSMLIQAAGITVVAGALNILAVAMKIFATMSWGQLAKGLAGVFGSLAALVVPLAVLVDIGPGLLLTAPALLGISAAMVMLGVALKKFGSMSLKQLVIGLFGFTASLLLLSEAMWAFPPGPYLIMQAAGLAITVAALEGLAIALAMFGGMSVAQLAKGIIGMGLALGVLAVGLGALGLSVEIFGGGGVLALMGAAAALAVLGPAIGFIGQLSIMTIIKGLAGIAAVLALLAVAGVLAAPGIEALGLALIPWAVAMGFAAAATFLFAEALALMGGKGAKGVGVMIAAFTGFVLLLPKFILGIVRGLIDTVGAIADMLPKVIGALDKILTTVIAFIIREAPKLALAIGALVVAISKIISDNAPKLMQTGIFLLETLLSGIMRNIGRVTNQVATIVERFLHALAGQAPALVQAGAAFLIAWITGIGNNASRVVGAGIRAVTKFILGVARALPRLYTLGLRVVIEFLGGIAKNIGQAFIHGAHMLLRFLKGIASVVPQVIRQAVEIAGRFVRSIARGLVRLADVGAQAIINFLNGMARVIRHRAPEIRKAGWNLASALIEGLTGGFGDLWHKVTGKVTELAHHLPHWFRKLWGIKSPSTVFREIGKFAMDGLAQGLGDSSVVDKAAETSGHGAIRAMKKTMANVPGLLDGINTSPTITPVLDLSQVEKHAGRIHDLTKAPPVTLATNSMAQVAALAHEKLRTDRAHAEAATKAAKPSVEFKQFNTSPEALPPREIYRRTNNQLSKIRKEVGLQ
jgi:tape measure domain-containing protein